MQNSQYRNPEDNSAQSECNRAPSEAIFLVAQHQGLARTSGVITSISAARSVTATAHWVGTIYHLEHLDGLRPLGAVEVGGEEEERLLLAVATADAEGQVGAGHHQLTLQVRQLLPLLLRLLVRSLRLPDKGGFTSRSIIQPGSDTIMGVHKMQGRGYELIVNAIPRDN